jgi:hypothetical protein
MRYGWAGFLLCAVFCTAFQPVGRAQTGIAAKYAPDRVLVKFRRGTPVLSRQIAHAKAGAQVQRRFDMVDGLELVSLPSTIGVHEAIHAYRLQPDVEYAEPDYIIHAMATPNDPQFPLMWNLQNTGQSGGIPGADVNAAAAWNLTTGSSSVVVAVIDTGIDYTHQDLAANVWSAAQPFSMTAANGTVACPAGSRGFNALANTCNPLDDNGHGTHVSGTIGAVGNNSLGVTGVNWTVQLMACKFLDANGSGVTSNAITCLQFVKMMKDSGVDVVATNNSWGGSDYSQALTDAIQAQEQDGILFIAAAGNDFSNNDLVPVYPASTFLPNVIAVAATTRTDSAATFSNVGLRTVHLGAPGQEILSTLPGNTYGLDTGTSMATPHVTGAAALLAAQNPSRDWRAIKNLILSGGAQRSSLAQTITGRRLDLFGSMTCSGRTVSSRLEPVGDATAAAVGTPDTIAVLNINCAQPAGGMQVTVSPGGQILTLADDGNGADIAAGDGVYSAQWTPPGEGSYTLTFPGGEVVGVSVLDNYSYAATAFNYRTITGNNLNLGDDAVGQITSPFPISFGNGSFTQLMVSSNGTISFTDNYSAFFNQGVGVGLPVPITLVAPFWMDLYPVPNTAQNVFWDVTGAAPNRELVVEWRNVRSFRCKEDASATVTFEVVFSEASSDVLFEYSDVIFGDACPFEDYGSNATIGMQVAPTVGTLVSYDEPRVESGSAILWQIPASPPPSNPVPTLTSFSPSSLTIGSPDSDVTVNGSNFVPTSVVQRYGIDNRPTTYISSTQLQVRILASDMGVSSAPFPPQMSVFNPAPGGGHSNELTLTLANPVPTITSISPTLMPAGSFGFTLVVNGTGFVWTISSVYWNGSLLGLANVLSSTQLLITVPATYITNPGAAQITVVNPAPGGGTSNPVSFTVAPASAMSFFVTSNGYFNAGLPPQDTFPSHPTRFLGWKYARAAGADYSKVFLRNRASQITEQPPPTGVVNAFGSINLQNPANLAGLQLHPLLPADFIPTSVAAGDFNGDGITDWVVANGGSNNLWVYLGKGGGTSQLPTILPTGVAPVAVAVADLRHNGKQDIIVAEADSGTIGVFLGNGDGTFGPRATYFVPGAPVSLAVTDFDGDGHPDIVAGLVPDSNSAVLVFLRGDGTGGFSPPIFQPASPDAPYTAQTVVAADLENNGLPDVVVVDPNDSGVWVFQNAGGGVFKPGSLAYGNPFISPVAVAAGDLNEDGCLDLVVLDAIGVARVFLGNCDGTVQAQSSQVGEVDVGGAVALADVNSDGHLDLIYAGVAFSPIAAFGASGQESGRLLGVHFGDGKGNFGIGHACRGGQTTFSLAVADLNGDGKPDVITANQDSDSATTFINDGQGGFGVPAGEYIGYIDQHGSGTVNVPISNMYATDIDGDGKTDLAVIELPSPSTNAYEVAVMLNDGTGHFAPAVHSPVFDPTYQLTDYVLADFRNTGRSDFLAVGYTVMTVVGPPFLSFAANTGGGSFALPRTSQPSDAWGALGVGDFNHDGKLDFITVHGVLNPAAGAPTQVLTVFLGNGDGTFTRGTSILFGTENTSNGALGVYGVYVGDFNHDGKLDVLVSMGDVYEFLGNGDGTFAAPKLMFSGLGPIEMADLNHDGLLDIVETNVPVVPVGGAPYPPPQFTIYLGRPDGTFQMAGTYAPYSGSAVTPYGGVGTVQGSRFASWIGDFNGDGNVDIAAFQYLPQNFHSNYVQFLLGNGDGTFTPTFGVYDLGQALPGTAADFNGDGRADLAELDGFPSSIHVIPGGVGSPVQVALVSDPVIGATGTARVMLAGTAAAPATVALAASDPAITIAPTTVIPPGSISQDVPFQIGSSFNSNHVFSIQASLGSSNAVAYGTQAVNGQFGFQIGAQYPFLEAVVGQTARLVDEIGVGSIAGYATTVTFTCQNLPAGAACQFGLNPVILPAGGEALSALTVSASSSTPLGTVPFKVVASDGVVTQSLALTLQVDPTVSVYPGAWFFGTQLLATPLSAGTITLTNSGQSALTINSIAVAGANSSDFGVTHNCPLTPNTLAAGSVCGIQATFTPTATGPRKSSISVSHSLGIQTVILTGVGTAISASPSTLSFGGQTVGTPSTPQPVTIANKGRAVVNLWQIAIGGANAGDFSKSNTSNCGNSLGAGANCTVNVIFTPAATGSRIASLLISDDAGGSPQAVTLAGGGTPGPAARLSTSAVVFGEQAVGTSSSAETVVLTNQGSAPLAIGSMTVAGATSRDFTQTNTCGSSLAVGASCTIEIRFTPRAMGTRTAVINVLRSGSLPLKVQGTGIRHGPRPILETE